MKEGIIFLIKNTRPDSQGVTAMGCECALALLATMWFPRVRQGAQLVGRNSFHAGSTKGMQSRGRLFWRSLLRAASIAQTMEAPLKWMTWRMIGRTQ